MNNLKLELENCYGIRKLEENLDFSQTRAVAIYAPNGAMKTSLAETFRDIAQSRATVDRIFPDRPTKRVVVDEAGNALDENSVVVIKSYEDVIPNEKTSLLLVNSELRLELEKLLKGVQSAEEGLAKSLRKVSGSKRIEREISATFTKSDNQFIKALTRVKEEVAKQEGAPFKDVPYERIFDAKTLAFLSSGEFTGAVEAYVKSYNALIDKSKYFHRGVFNYYNASTIAKNLADNGFFKAKHTVKLNGSDAVEINDVKQLEQIIQAEKDSITNDAELRKKYGAIEKGLNKNQELRDLQNYLAENEHLLPYLANIEEFREEVLKSYLKSCFDQVQTLLQLVEETDGRRQEIEQAARSEQTQWQEVIATFNDRFSVPFRLEVENLVAVILGLERAPRLGFTFVDGDEEVPVEKAKLMAALSTGETKAFYILNILFDIQVRMKSGQHALFVIDDIADSFDYKNKYAIIEYLRDTAEHPMFRQIVLTHNFDFFRTACSRYVGRQNCFMATKTKDKVILQESYGVKNVFEFWKSRFYVSDAIAVATIPFIRNVAEYTMGQDSNAYLQLTKMLHVQPDSSQLTLGDLDFQFNTILGKQGAHANREANLFDYIFNVANACVDAPEGVNFENKIVLSIAIRLAAEQLMISRLNDQAAVAALTGNQTGALSDLYRTRFPDDSETNALLRQVLLMTPESIHLNSFMYEPIVDMSDEHLRRLYAKIKAAMQG